MRLEILFLLPLALAFNGSPLLAPTFSGGPLLAPTRRRTVVASAALQEPPLIDLLEERKLGAFARCGWRAAFADGGAAFAWDLEAPPSSQSSLGSSTSPSSSDGSAATSSAIAFFISFPACRACINLGRHGPEDSVRSL